MSLTLELKKKSLNKKEVLREQVFLYFEDAILFLPVMRSLKKTENMSEFISALLAKIIVFISRIYKQSLYLNLFNCVLWSLRVYVALWSSKGILHVTFFIHFLSLSIWMRSWTDICIYGFSQ